MSDSDDGRFLSQKYLLFIVLYLFMLLKKVKISCLKGNVFGLELKSSATL